jgi:hypothetical protein
MGSETSWRSPSLSSEGPPLQKDGLLADRGIDIEAALDSRTVLCDCHCEPMYYFPVSLIPDDAFEMCWVSECGRCYNSSLGYFHLRAARPTLARINEDTRRMTLCPNENCSSRRSMAITRSDGASSGEDKSCWHCFDCGSEFPSIDVRGLWKRLLRRFRPFSYQMVSVKD